MFRRMGTAGYSLLAAVVVGGSLGYAVAQEGADSTVDVVKVEPMGASAAQEALSPAAQAQAAEAAVANANASCTAQSQALQSAKRDKDIILATCLDDKLSQCNANLQNIKRREAALNEAIAEGDTGRSNHEFTVIGVLSQKFKMLAQAANQCVGQDLFDTGDTQVKEEVDLFVPDEDPAVITQVPDWPVLYIPPPVSGVN
jgi:PP-loop superfamily ATP-utilizing enzyme